MHSKKGRGLGEVYTGKAGLHKTHTHSFLYILPKKTHGNGVYINILD